jgi:hypothetical protein
MSRISSSSFKVNSDLEQLVSITNSTAIPVSDSSALTKLTAIDTNTTGLNNCVSGNELQIDIVACSPTLNVADASALTKLTAIDTNTQNIPAAGQAAMAASLPVAIATNQSAVPVSMSNANNSGSANNLNSSSSVSSGDFSSEVDTRTGKNITILGLTSDTSGTKIEIHASPSSGSGYVKWLYDIYPDSNGNFAVQMNGVAINYLKIKYFSTATVTATALFN